jgi:hypothetical protein
VLTWPQSIESWREETALDSAMAQSLTAFSGHFPFFMAGVPTGGIESAERSLAGRGYGHTQHDTVDKVQVADVREAAALTARLVLRMAGTENWPVTRRTGKAVLELLDSPEYREETDYRQRLDGFYREARIE